MYREKRMDRRWEGKKDKEKLKPHSTTEAVTVHHVRFLKCQILNKKKKEKQYRTATSHPEGTLFQESAGMFQLLGADKHPQPLFLATLPLPFSP